MTLKEYIKKKNDIETVKELIIFYMPKGSGFNFDWHVEYKRSYFKVTSSYHVMNGNGFYVGWADFSVIIPVNDPLDFRLHFHGSYSQYLNKQYLLREYIEDSIYYQLEKMLEVI